jgi:hypothetical protein
MAGPLPPEFFEKTANAAIQPPTMSSSKTAPITKINMEEMFIKSSLKERSMLGKHSRKNRMRNE